MQSLILSHQFTEEDGDVMQSDTFCIRLGGVTHQQQMEYTVWRSLELHAKTPSHIAGKNIKFEH